MAERRDPADGKPGRRPGLVGVGGGEAEPVGGHAAIAGTQHHQRLAVAHEHQRLDDLADLAAEGGGGLRGRAGGVGEGDDVDLNAVVGQSLLQSGGGGMHALFNLIAWGQ